MGKGNVLYLDCGCYLTINIRQKSLNCIPKKKVNWWVSLYVNYILINPTQKTRQLKAKRLKIVSLENVNKESLGFGFIYSFSVIFFLILCLLKLCACIFFSKIKLNLKMVTEATAWRKDNKTGRLETGRPFRRLWQEMTVG